MYGVNNIRFGGIASGLDTEDIVNQMMKIEKMKVDRHHQQKQVLEWKREDYRELNSKFLNLRNEAFDMRLQSSYMSREVSSSNESALSATAGSSAIEGNYEVEIKELARGVNKTSDVLQSNDDISNLKAQFGEDIGDEVSFTLKGQSGEQAFTFNTEEVSIHNVVREINNANLGIRANYDANIDRFFLMTTDTGTNSELSVLTDDGFLSDQLKLNLDESTTLQSTESLGESINTDEKLKEIFPELVGESDVFNISIKIGKDVEELSFGANDNIDTIIDEINDKLGEDVASFNDNKFSINGDEENNVSILSDEEGLLTNIFKLQMSSETGVNSKINFNDMEDLEFQSNDVEIMGINMNLQQAGETVNLTVSNDTDAVVEKITGFVDKYNKIIENISTKLGEERHRDFPPLTDEQRRAMSEDEIEMWEEKARSGHFRADPLLNSIASNLRMATSSPVEGIEGDYQQLSAIGISTQNWQEQGKLHVDEDKLRAALSDDLEGVIQLFTQDRVVEEDENGNEVVEKGPGIARALHEAAGNAIDSIRQRAGIDGLSHDPSFLGQQISREEQRIADMKQRMIRTEERLWSQFSAMERAVAEMNSQSDWLASQLGQMG
ncbi:Flagellar cap protein FliD [Candidatus Syntrophocurvum alkaliphilum]|uniref:Flagellar hook-associated protein 2 n=1 Tax=Candidatus Syntrophocurvum alkaliphilum TaxID=2293317 RepID=A0A6I6DI49_9FIRM|nr:flagellar filament capping protein FliD [Candidatus Syntrophocurvum alkaliphilum]QGU00429.1 Flagellar cap protein FliD [Candidatus Syntrophocurvum alkaliphilum]